MTRDKTGRGISEKPEEQGEGSTDRSQSQRSISPNVARGAHSAGHIHQDAPEDYQGDSKGAAQPEVDRYAGTTAGGERAGPYDKPWDDSEREGGLGSLYREEFRMRGYGRSGYGEPKVPKVRDRHGKRRQRRAPSAAPRETIRSSAKVAGRQTSNTAPGPPEPKREERPRLRGPSLRVQGWPRRTQVNRGLLRPKVRGAKAATGRDRVMDSKTQYSEIRKASKRGGRRTRVPRSSVYSNPESYTERTKGGIPGGGRGMLPGEGTKRHRMAPGRSPKGGRDRATHKTKGQNEGRPRRPGAMRQGSRGGPGRRRA